MLCPEGYEMGLDFKMAQYFWPSWMYPHNIFCAPNFFINCCMKKTGVVRKWDDLSWMFALCHVGVRSWRASLTMIQPRMTQLSSLIEIIIQTPTKDICIKIHLKTEKTKNTLSFRIWFILLFWNSSRLIYLIHKMEK